jgi:hypothetical protein
LGTAARLRPRPSLGAVLQVLYPLREGTAVDEQVLEHLEGYRGSRPVRIGNGAALWSFLSVLYLASAEHRRTPGPPPLGAEAAGTSPDADPS